MLRYIHKRKFVVGAVSTAHAALKWVHVLLLIKENPLDSSICSIYYNVLGAKNSNMEKIASFV